MYIQKNKLTERIVDGYKATVLNQDCKLADMYCHMIWFIRCSFTISQKWCLHQVSVLIDLIFNNKNIHIYLIP